MKTNAAGVTTLHLEEGQTVGDPLPEGVQLVGPGAAPIHEALQQRLAAARGETQEAPAAPVAQAPAAEQETPGTPATPRKPKAAQGRTATRKK
jgi:hypothetical protein